MCLRIPVCALFLFFYVTSASANDDDKWFIVSMGDSITAGYNTRWPGNVNNARYSWATGTSKKVKSHSHQLKKIISKNVTSINVAKSGATSYELEEQLKKVKAPTIDYMTLLIGANDVCDWTEEYAEDMRKFRHNVKSIIDQAIATNAAVRIVMPSIPNMYRLYEQGKDTCGPRWDYFKACPILLNSARTDAERLAFRDRLIAANETLKKLATKYEDNVKFVEEVFKYEFSLDHLSRYDCFHPSVEGQNELAQITWMNGWYLPN